MSEKVYLRIPTPKGGYNYVAVDPTRLSKETTTQLFEKKDGDFKKMA
tara:strand:- start:94 stop:234 length:141 start_codon:yes stop_codon:yes gene_type:complete